MRILFLLLFASLFQIGCSTTAKSVTYSNKTARTNKSVRIIEHLTNGEGGTAAGVVNAGGVMVTTQTKGHSRLIFDQQDQSNFILSLKSEIARTGLAKVVAQKPLDAEIQFYFISTQQIPGTNRYIIKSEMRMTEPSGNSTTKKYTIDSDEDIGTFARMNTNAAEGKTRAAQRLLNQVIPDVEAFLKDK